MDGKTFQALLLKYQRDVEKAVNDDIPYMAGQTAVDMFKDNFQDEGFFGAPWKEVQRRMDTYAVRGKVRKNYAKGAFRTRKILTGKTAELARSIDFDPKGHGEVEVFSDKDYASYHNDGVPPQPQRQFIGDHPQLRQAIEHEIDRKLRQIFGL